VEVEPDGRCLRTRGTQESDDPILQLPTY
jgi:hypothetical protein